MAHPRTRESRETELGTEIQCARCREFWPADEEFFYVHKGRWHSWCKACYLGSECFLAKRARWLAKQQAARSARRGAAPIAPLPQPVLRTAGLVPIELPREPWARLVAQLGVCHGAAA